MHLLENELATSKLGQNIASLIINNCLQPSFEIHLEGNLGAGKTTIARSIIKYLGWNANVKSPTFSICEEYSFNNLLCLHVDLYRIDNQFDIDMLGLDDPVRDKQKIIIIEWPENIPYKRVPELQINIDHHERKRIFKVSGSANKFINNLTKIYA
ncbi:MAG: tRNA (adenosine(37)-N6)-threonylcarbamoyltransferase complex ATPase subunit type 1 TsaE [Gammaproteobacteria bacterium]|nr:MAG: tRNA (adenosine(37)-N6)-threonylcarbamoyltransferase complex ATPase subunit type 1 TsaE [Gammaproteobacteria bacterium]|tara:strand:- start:24 stop:488 length:465 start_codon:yes stop_codon:yes gene_type:complete